jgi:hypothetical protein
MNNNPMQSAHDAPPSGKIKADRQAMPSACGGGFNVCRCTVPAGERQIGAVLNLGRKRRL